MKNINLLEILYGEKTMNDKIKQAFDMLQTVSSEMSQDEDALMKIIQILNPLGRRSR